MIISKIGKKYKSSKLYGAGDAGIRIAKIIEKINPPVQKILKY